LPSHWDDARHRGDIDTDFDKPRPRYKIAKPPFFAAWAAPVIHDTRGAAYQCALSGVGHEPGDDPGSLLRRRVGRRERARSARAICQGLIAGRNAAAESDDV
jgi:hypothetical protein